MSIPQNSISVPFGSEWRIRRPHLYRYLEIQFVEEFFNSGLLRLSSFDTFSKHEDEQRLDKEEGRGMVTYNNKEKEGKGQTIGFYMQQGHNAYVLCTSMLYKNELEQSFKTNSGFRINDIFGFANAVSRHVPGFTFGIEGTCIYQEKRILMRDGKKIDLDILKSSQDKDSYDVQKIMQLGAHVSGDDLYFLKSSIYAHQSEYRLIWNTANQVNTHLDIMCPEARQFCTRFEEIYTEIDP